MKMRKIIAVLAAALMLCSVIPMGAISVSAAPGDVVIDADFNDGTDGFNNFPVADGALVLDGTSADWANAYAYANAIKPSTTYQVNFRAKADTNKALSFKINNGWNGVNVQADANITTEWQEFELLLTPDSNLTSPIFTIQTGTYASGGTVYYIDYVKVTEWQDPVEIGKVVNGGFEDGNANWTCDSSASVYTADAAEGSQSLKLANTGYYASAATQIVPVKANTVYELSWKSKRLSGTGTFNVILCQPVSPWANYAKVSGQNWMNETSGNWVNNSYTINTGDNTSMLIKWTSERSGDAGEILLDDIRLIEVKDPSYDGYIYNGDFETGKTDSWTNLWNSNTVELVEGYNSDYAIKGTANGLYSIVYQEVVVEPNTDYTVCAFSKNANNSALWIKNAGGNGDITNTRFNTGSEWALTTLNFNSGSNSTVWIGLMGETAGATYTVDNVMMYEKVDESNDGYLKNGNFETAVLSPWTCIWSDQISAAIVPGGKDSNWAMTATAQNQKTWGQVRQSVAVEPNTDYKVTVWVKNVKSMSLLIKDSADLVNLKQTSINVGDEWTEYTAEFNSGTNSSVYVGVMADLGDSYGTFDNFVMEKLTPACEHEYDNDCDKNCSICGEETRPEPPHYPNNYPCNHYCTVCLTPLGNTADHVDEDGDTRCDVCDVRLGCDYGYHTYDSNCDADCNECGEPRVAPHSSSGYPCYNYCIVCLTPLGNTADHVDEDGDTFCDVCNTPLGCDYGYHTYGGNCDADCNECGETRVAPHYPSGYPCNNYCAVCLTDLENTATHVNEDGDTRCDVCYELLGCEDGYHTYDNDFDVDCNVCGDVRAVACPITFGGNSVSGDVSGLAFKFDVAVDGMAVNGTTAIYDNATVNGYKLVKMGAVVSNSKSSKDIEAVYLCDLESDSASYAVRIINIPEANYDDEITAVPYIVIEVDGEEITIEGEAQIATYNGVLG